MLFINAYRVTHKTLANYNIFMTATYIHFCIISLPKGSPPQPLSLIQTRRLCFFGHVGDWATRTSSEPYYIRRVAGCPSTGGTAMQDVHVTPGYRPSAAQLSMATRPVQRMMEAACGNGYAHDDVVNDDVDDDQTVI